MLKAITNKQARQWVEQIQGEAIEKTKPLPTAESSTDPEIKAMLNILSSNKFIKEANEKIFKTNEILERTNKRIIDFLKSQGFRVEP